MIFLLFFNDLGLIAKASKFIRALYFRALGFLVVLSFAPVENSAQFFVEFGLKLYVLLDSACLYISNNIGFILFGAWMLKLLRFGLRFFGLFQADEGKTEQN